MTILRIEGMSCGGCSSRVQDALAAVPGVTSATVDLETALATVIGTADQADLVKAVEAVGKRAVPAEGDDTFNGYIAPQCRCTKCRCNGNCKCTEMHVELNCDGCSKVVGEALESVQGVESTVIDVKSGVAYVAGTASTEDLLAAVQSTGRTAQLKYDADKSTGGDKDDADLLDMPPRMREAMKKKRAQAAAADGEKTPVGVGAPSTSAPAMLTFKVDGLACGHCVDLVEKTLMAVKGVASAKVELDEARATVNGTASADALIAAVEAAGKQMSLMDAAPVTLYVRGMVCLGCSATVKRALMAVSGVESSAVDLASQQVIVSGRASVSALQAAIEGAGKFVVFAQPPENVGPAAGRRLIKLLIADMVCNGCKDKIELALKMISGVEAIEVDLDVHRVDVKGSADTTALLGAITAAGYDVVLESDEPLTGAGGSSVACSRAPPPNAQESGAPASAKPATTKDKKGKDTKGKDAHAQSVRLLIDGMSCASCVAAIEGALVALEGVTSAAISLMANSGEIKFDTRYVDVPAIVSTVTSIGYHAEVAEDGNGVNVSNYDKEALKWRRYFIGSSLFTVPVFTLSMILKHIPPFHDALLHQITPGLPVVVLVLCILTTPVQLFFGLPFHKSAVAALRHRTFNMDVLVSVGTWAAYLYSIVFLIVSLVTKGEQGLDNEQFETAAMLITFILLGKYLETSAKGRASQAISKLLTLQPPTALQLERCKDVDATPVEVPVAGLRRGDVVKVLPGSQVPVDGVVLYGSSAVDESMITGESMPQAKRPNDRVVGGTLNGTGVLFVLVTAVGADSTLAQIMKVVADAQLRKPEIQAFADRISRVFVPTVLVLSALTWITWAAIGAAGAMPQKDDDGHMMGNNTGMDGGHGGMNAISVDDHQLLAFMFGCAVLVIACPCALGLATPTAVMVGSGIGAAHGILIKGGDVLERAAHAKAVLFDKTGTLTTGKLSVSRVLRFNESIPEERLLWAAASAERGSEHPIAGAIMAHADSLKIQMIEPRDFVAAAGQGLQCVVDDVVVLLGNRSWMKENGMELDEKAELEVCALESQGNTVVLVAMGDGPDSASLILAGALAVADTLKPDASSVVAQLRQHGMQVWMVSGDNVRTARHIAAQAGIAEECVVAGVKPAGKLDKVQELRDEGIKVAFVGDGVNDAPALAAADVGIAVGSGTDVAIETADVVLMKNTLHDVVVALHLSRRVMRRIAINFVWAFAYNVIGIPLAAGALYPAFHIQFPPMFAGAAMAMSSVSVICSSLLLRLYQPPKPLAPRRTSSRGSARHAAAQAQDSKSVELSVAAV